MGKESGDAGGCKMKYRYLSKNCGLRVSVLGFGTWVTVGATIPDGDSEALITEAYDAGINFFDTAEVYAGGKAEQVLGNVIKKKKWKRSTLVISTKIYWGGRGENERGLSRKHIVEGLNGSLERLQLDYVDLVFAQRPDPHTPMEEIVRAMTFMINQGKAFYWGTSQWSAADIMEAHATARLYNLIPPSVEQAEYHMFHREQVESDLLPVYSKVGIGCVTWSPLAGGLLTGKYNDGVPEDSRAALKGYEWLKAKILSAEGAERRAKIKDIARVAESLGCTTAQLAIAWIVRNENVSCTLLGASSAFQLKDNIKAVQVAELLTEGVVREIETILLNRPVGRRDYRS